MESSNYSLTNQLLPHLFRQEYAKITAVLYRHFGLDQMELAEDLVSETFLKASEIWMVQGIPENPAAWLYTVAKNKTKDYLKRRQIFDTKIKSTILYDTTTSEINLEFSQLYIADSQLAMIFAVCNPTNPTEAQICLALQILCGFSVEEIANAFLTKTETIKKRLLRARTKLRSDAVQINNLSETEIRSRLSAVLKTLYLLFNEGYFSKTGKLQIRKELCSEAIRLTLILAEKPETNTQEVNALMALMCFQSSRLEARTDERGEAVLFEEQDQNVWDTSLINTGTYYLMKAFAKPQVSKYHLEASIAYWHTTLHEQKWQQILQLYNQLLVMEYSPVTALNRTFAFAKVYGNTEAIKEAEKIDLAENNYYHSLLGFLYSDTDIEKAIAEYQKSISLTKSDTEKKVLRKKIDELLTR